MKTTNIHQAKSQLSKLIEHAMKGEEVIISKAGHPMVRLVPVGSDIGPRTGGQWRGKVHMSEDFDTLPPDIASAFGMDHLG
jgi:prevent-host-death family protein